METIEIGASPWGEDCAQVGRADYPERSRAECKAFIAQLERAHPIPEGVSARYVVVSSSHEFGTYREVGIKFDQDDERAATLAYDLDSDSPERWDDEARAELAAAGFPVEG